MDVIQLVRDLGIPVALLLAVIYGGWQGCQWLATEAVRPLVRKMMEFLDRLEVMVDRIATKLDKVADQQSGLLEKVERIGVHGCANYSRRVGPNEKTDL